MKFLSGTLWLVYFLMGIVQLAAIYEGIQVWWGLPWLLTVLIAGFFAYFPIIGTIIGICGAITGWGLSPFAAILLHIGPWGLLFLAGIISNTSGED